MLKGVEDLVNLRFITRTVTLLNRLNCVFKLTGYVLFHKHMYNTEYIKH